MNIPRSEHPNPQFFRENWQNLNGEWEFEIDKSCSGKARKLYNAKALKDKIIVPFCPESKLSGISDTDFLNSVWYKRTINIDSKQNNIVLHIGACDYFTTVYINGKAVGTHAGGYTSFSFDITDFVKIGENTLIINATDDNRTRLQPCGKQSIEYASTACYYTRTTGIWQTVWLEEVPKKHIKSVKYYPDAQSGKINIKAKLAGSGTLCATAYYNGKAVGSAQVYSFGANADLTVTLSEIHLWEVGHGRLYDLELKFEEDTVKSYFGLRNVCLDGYKFLINGKSVFQRLVLDQGFYPDGIYTASSEQALINDIELSLKAGFNGARLHEKVFEPRFLYHCDKMGYIVWGEYANWGLDHTKSSALPIFLREWEEAIERNFNHPAIIGWCPFNETWDLNGRQQKNEILELVYKTTKLLDTTRPCIDTSGNYHVITDIFDFHDYIQDVPSFEKIIKDYEKNDIINDQIVREFGGKNRQTYNGEPVFVSEYGGIKWVPDNFLENNNYDESWGYGNAPKTKEEFISRYKGLTDAILKCPKIFGLCYTQLYDVEQEQNGLYTYERNPKFDMEIFRKINTQKAAIED